tara:strand:+ start:266 stop:739 length:474 start_codon:yes stop_codon:yes gene_type:complete
MSKIARAARVASRQRVETLGNGTSAATAKTIAAAETGELYFIDHNHASELLITLPPKQDGAYFKFILKTNLTAAGTIKITSSEAAGGDMVGSVFVQVTGGANANSAVVQDTDNTDHQVTISPDTHQGSYLECYCDGTTWIMTGHLNSAAVNDVAFGT